MLHVKTKCLGQAVARFDEQRAEKVFFWSYRISESGKEYV